MMLIAAGAWLRAQDSASSVYRADALPGVSAQAASLPAADFSHDIRPMLQKYCFECHNSQTKEAGLALDVYETTDQLLAHRAVWDHVAKYVRTLQMPPDDADALPTDEERRKLSGFVDHQLLTYYQAHPDPGRVTMRRLNKSEYNNTIRDLIGVDVHPADDFPQDDSGYGFDNIGDVLSLPPVLMEKYLAAADKILDEAIPTEAPISRVRHISAAQAEVGFNAAGDRGDGWVKLISLEEDDVAVELPVQAGDYIVRLKAFCQRTGGALVGQGSSVPIQFEGHVDPTKLGIFVGDTFVKDVEIDATEADPKIYEARVGVAGGKQRFRASVRRNRGGIDNETYVLNGRIGKQQPGIVFVRYLEIEGPLPAAIERVAASRLDKTGAGRSNAAGGWIMNHNGEVSTTLDVEKPGEYILRVQASAQQAGDEPAKMEIRLNDAKVQTFDIVAPSTLTPLPKQKLFDINLLNARPYVYEIKASLPAGKVKLSAAFVNEFADASSANPNLRERNLTVDYIEYVNPGAPLPPPPMPATMAGYFVTKNGAGTREAADEIIGKFARRAYRRPVAAGEVGRLMTLYDLARSDGEGYKAGLKLAMKGVLVSPRFLFLGHIAAQGSAAMEVSPREVASRTRAADAPAAASAVREVDELALASRLSYYLWSSMPDEELIALAQKHELRKNLESQTQRMLASPKAQALIENFAGQWLQLRNMPNLAPDKDLFPGYDDRLRKAMSRETELLFESVVRDDLNVLTFLTADYTYLNGRLAQFYGIESGPGGKPISGEEFVKVSLKGTNRRGVLTQGSILSLTSNPTRTSPVKRGKFVLENLLGTPPPPPPPDVPPLENQKAVAGTLRHQMETHRTNPVCASCHAQMDPIGFGMENFDAIGKWRDKDSGGDIDAAGKLKTGETFTNTAELVAILAVKRRSDFVHCLTEKMLTYALGRGVEMYDRPAVESIVSGMDQQDYRFSSLVMGVVKSLPFQMELASDE